MRALCLWHQSPHWSPGMIRLIWLTRRVYFSFLTTPGASSQNCMLNWRAWPAPHACSAVKSVIDPRDDHPLAKGIWVAVLPCQNLPTRSQGPYVGECRIVKLPRLQTHQMRRHMWQPAFLKKHQWILQIFSHNSGWRNI